jgi:predicted nuclease with TOPRIM domain
MKVSIQRFTLSHLLLFNYRKVLATLDQTRSDAKAMRKAIKTISGKFQEATKTTEDLLYKLTVKATALEKLKAKFTTTYAISAFHH